MLKLQSFSHAAKLLNRESRCVAFPVLSSLPCVRSCMLGHAQDPVYVTAEALLHASSTMQVEPHALTCLRRDSYSITLSGIACVRLSFAFAWNFWRKFALLCPKHPQGCDVASQVNAPYYLYVWLGGCKMLGSKSSSASSRCMCGLQ